MTITLGELRQYASETASSDASSLTADREILNWINAALEEVWISFDWSWALEHIRLVLLPEETGSFLAVTQGSRVLTLNAAQTEFFDQRWVDEKWDLVVQGDTRQTFRLERIEGPQRAVLVDGQVWTQPTAADQTYTFLRSSYPVPGGALKLCRVEDLDSFGELAYVSPAQYDRFVNASPSNRGNGPEVFTLRRDRLEVWPGPGTNYVSLGVTYKRPAPRFVSTDPVVTEIDWPVKMRGLIDKAILVQAALTQGKNSPVPYERAMYHYGQALSRHQSEDADNADLGGPMSLEGPGRRWDGHGPVSITDSFA